MFAFGPIRQPRRPSLTPLIDVVFLLLVFFMLAARFGVDQALPLSSVGTGREYSGPPRLVDLRDEGLFLNGFAVSIDTLPERLAPLVTTPNDTIVLRPGAGIDLQTLVDTLDTLRSAGFTALVVTP